MTTSRELQPGDHVGHFGEGDRYVIKERKDSDDGWWLEDDQGGNQRDAVWDATNWMKLPPPGEVEVPDELELDDTMTAGEQAEIVHQMNEEGASLSSMQAAGQPGSLENAFDAVKMLVLLEHIATDLDVRDVAMLDFEGRRAKMLDAIETKYRQGQEAMAAAERAQRLAGGPTGRRGGQRMVPGPGGRMMPAPE